MNDESLRQLFLSILDTNEDGMLITMFAEDVNVQLHTTLLKLATDRGYFDVASYLRSFSELRVDANNVVHLTEKNVVTAHIRDMIKEERKATTMSKSKHDRSGTVYSPLPPNRSKLAYVLPETRYACVDTSRTILKAEICQPPEPAKVTKFFGSFDWSKVKNKDSMFFASCIAAVCLKLHSSQMHPNVFTAATRDPDPEPDAFSSPDMHQRETEPRIREQREFEVMISQQRKPDPEVVPQRQFGLKVSQQREPDSKVGEQRQFGLKVSEQHETCPEVVTQRQFGLKASQQRKPDPEVVPQRQFGLKSIKHREAVPEVVRHLEPAPTVGQHALPVPPTDFPTTSTTERRQFGLKSVQDREQDSEVDKQREF